MSVANANAYLSYTMTGLLTQRPVNANGTVVSDDIVTILHLIRLQREMPGGKGERE
jgi:hypothetical protein